MGVLLTIFFLICSLVLYFLSDILKFIRVRKFAKTLPGPSIGELMKNAKNGTVLPWLCDLTKEYKSAFRIWLGTELMVIFSDPEDVKDILSSTKLLYKSSNYNFIKAWLGEGLLTNGGQAWQQRRKMLTPAFHFKILSQFNEPMKENCKILISKLREKANGEAFDISKLITLFTLDVICETAMGIKKNAQLHSDSEYVQAVNSICHILHKQSFSFWNRILNVFKLNYTTKEVSKVLNVLHSETNRVIKLRRQLLQDSGIPSIDEKKSSEILDSKKRFAFLDMLLISQMEGNGLTDHEIREEVDTFLFGGHDTTSAAISFTLFSLSQHADVQQKAFEEALEFEGRENEPMPYLEAVIKESMRIYPIGPFFSRNVTEDVQVGDITVPKGANIIILLYMTHRDENTFPDPEKFNPERFLNSNEKELKPFSFLPFSAGPRNCLGQKFAFLEMKTAISALLRNFEILPVKDFKPILSAQIVIKSTNGLSIRLKQR